MKSFLVSATLIFVPLFTLQSHAEEHCVSEAVRAAKESAFSTAILESVEVLESGKAYLEKYRVVLSDSFRNPRKFEAYTVTLLKSDCNVSSLVPEL